MSLEFLLIGVSGVSRNLSSGHTVDGKSAFCYSQDAFQIFGGTKQMTNFNVSTGKPDFSQRARDYGEYKSTGSLDLEDDLVDWEIKSCIHGPWEHQYTPLSMANGHTNKTSIIHNIYIYVLCGQEVCINIISPVCMYVRMFVCMYIYIYKCIYICIHTMET